MALTTKQAAGYLNETLASLGYDYRIDDTSDSTLTQGFQAVGAFPPNMLDNILNMQMKILVQRAYTSMFTESKNPTRRFWRDAVDYGGGIQDTFVKLIEAEDGYWADMYDGTDDDTLSSNIAKDLVSFKKDEVINKIHTVNKRFRIKMSISDLEYAKVFTPTGYADFVGAKYANFQQSAEAHLMQIAISTIQEMITNKHVVFKSGLGLSNPNEVTGTVEALNTVSDGMETLTDIYNYDSVKTTSRADDIYLVITPEVYNRIKSRGYANAFNLQEYENKNKIIMLPAGTPLGVDPNGKAIGAVLVDVRAVLMAVKYWEVQPFIVSNTDYRNTFLKVQLIAGYSEFFNAVAFATGEVENFFPDSGLIIVAIDNSVTEDNNGIYVAGKHILSGGTVNTELPEYISATSNDVYRFQFPRGSLVEFDSPDSTYYADFYVTGSLVAKFIVNDDTKFVLDCDLLKFSTT